MLLWGNYVPGNWMSELPTSVLMPEEQIVPYVSYISELFKPYRPLYFVSGGVNLDHPDTTRYYKLALDCLKEHAPQALASMHICGNNNIPDILAQGMDFYTYQSGHNIADRHQAYGLARDFSSRTISLPVVNAEPCYEGHGQITQPGRHNRYDLRYAFWNSILGGAKAGFTYGAHGVWSWHRRGEVFLNEKWSKLPYEHDEALRLPGAWDIGFAKWLYDTYGLYRLDQFGMAADNEDVPLAACDSLFAAYLPYSNHIRPGFSLECYEVTGFSREDRRIFRPRLCADEIGMPQLAEDILLIGQKK